MPTLTQNQQAVQAKVGLIVNLATHFCNRVCRDAQMLGFDMMHIPDPDVHQLSNILDKQIVPQLSAMENDPHLLPEDGVLLANVREYNALLKRISAAIQLDDKDAFDQAVADLEALARLPA